MVGRVPKRIVRPDKGPIPSVVGDLRIPKIPVPEDSVRRWSHFFSRDSSILESGVQTLQGRGYG